MSTTESRFLDSVLAGARTGLVNGAPSRTIEPSREGQSTADECSACQSALSPLAYLADLLAYTLEHVKNGETPVTLDFLVETFHQPFDELPASCASLQRQVAQVRIAIEVLRSYLRAHPPATEAQTALAQVEQNYRANAYLTLLTLIGTSYDEIRQARTAAPEQRVAIAARLGIELGKARPDRLDALFHDPSTVTEADLERLFGLADTTRSPLAEELTPEILTWRLEHLRSLWYRQDWPGELPEGRRPFVDPDLIGPGNLVRSASGQEAARLWQARRAFVDDRIAALNGIRTGAPTAAAGLDQMITSVLGLTSGDLADLANRRDRGEDVSRELAALPLDHAALSYLLHVRRLVESGAPLLEAEWNDVVSILVQVEKERRFDQWLREERDRRVTLSPDYFQIARADTAVVEHALPAWRAKANDRRTWEETLRARIDQEQAIRDAHAKLIVEAEEAVLPELRDGLVMATATGAADLTARAKDVTDRLLVDARASGRQRTTRVAQAIETIQGLLFGVRTGQLQDTYPSLRLTAANFDEEWKWLGSYSSWRAAMVVFLYPENVLLPSLRRRSTPAFREVVEQVRAVRRLTPARAREAAQRFARHFEDVRTLQLDATCQARTRVDDGGAPGQAATYRHLLYMFGRGPATDTCYWSVYDPAGPVGSEQTFWEVVPGLGRVAEVVGALPYQVDSEERYLYLFVTTRAAGIQKLWFHRYHLERRVWDAEPTELELPFSKGSFRIHAIQSRNETAPPRLFLDGFGWYFRGLNDAGDGWEPGPYASSGDGGDAGDDWRHFRVPGYPSGTVRFHAVLKTATADPNSYWVVLTRPDRHLRVERWQNTPAAPQVVKSVDLGVNAAFVGAILWPVGDAVYVFFGAFRQPPSNRLVSATTDGAPGAVDANLQRIVWNASTAPLAELAVASQRRGEHGIRGYYRGGFTVSGQQLSEREVTQVTPLAPGPVTISEQITDADRARRRVETQQAYLANLDAPSVIRAYVDEAFYFLPVHLALQLQQSGHHHSALDWYRTVYDYSLPLDQRKISYLLKHEESLDGSLQRVEDWLLDPMNPHAIAKTRAGAYTRFTLLSIARGLLAFADAEFTRDTHESIARARTLYLTALELLDLPEFASAGAHSTALVADGRAGDGVSNGGTKVSSASEVKTLAAVVTTRATRLEEARSKLLARPSIGRAAAQLKTARLPADGGLATIGLAALDEEFCIPPNPVPAGLRLHAELNLDKLRNGRNIAGLERPIVPIESALEGSVGLPVAGADGQLAPSNGVAVQPTQYRYTTLIERAKQLAQIAAQTEAALLSALERRDAELYNLLKARQDVRLARAGVQLQTLRLREAEGSVKLAELQQRRAQLQADHFEGLLSAGLLAAEDAALDLMLAAAGLQTMAGTAGLFLAPVEALSSMAGAASTMASYLSTLASYERRRQEWELQLTLSEQDVRIGAQQIRLAEDHVRVAAQEQAIAEIQTEHAEATLDFLANKFTNAELFDWMSGVLERVYAYFLQQATAVAHLAASQLAFERQEVPPPFIQADYWEAPAAGAFGATGQTVDRHGLTGSARLLQDIVKLDQYAFETDRRKLQLAKTISLAQIAPVEFQRFRETGVLIFSTPMELFDREFPGHYLRLIKRVRTSVIALIPPHQGIRATLSTTGTSRVVLGGPVFPTATLIRGPESVALSSARDATGLFELNPQPEMLLPFENTGVDTTWELRMPRAANPFDFRTIADVLVTIEYTALDSAELRRQVIERLGDRIDGERPFSFRYQLADQWYDLHNPDQSTEPLTVRFQTTREDFPPNVDDLRVQHVAIVLARAEGATFEVEGIGLRYVEQGSTIAVGGVANTQNGVVSTRRGNGSAWTPIVGRSVVGTWELKLPDTDEVRARFRNEEVRDLLFVVTFSGRVPAWPA